MARADVEPPRRRAAVFDIDGTLTATNAVDDECFLRALAEVFELDVAALDWSAAPHMTDEGLLMWLAERHGRAPVDAAVRSRAMQRFFELLSEAAVETPHRFCEIPGSVAALRATRDAGWDVALATGSWTESARLKLASAGFDHDALAVATSSDAIPRTAIMKLALEKARIDPTRCDRIVAIGDAAWDVRAAAELGWPLVVIASGERAARRRRHGATTILPDYLDVNTFLEALDSAEVPAFQP